MLSTKLIESKV